MALMLSIKMSFCQIVTIGNGTESDDDIPIALYYKYSYSQSIYLASEINQSGNIYRIKYKGKSGLSLNNSTDWVVYIGHTNLTEFTPNIWTNTSQMTQVFSGSVTVVNDNVEITFSTPFNYNGTDNLIIAVDENTPGYAGSSYDFLSSNVTGARSILYRNDNNNPDPTTIDENTISQSAVPNIDVDFNAVSCTAPNTPTAANLALTSADLSWIAGASETNWDIEYGVNGFTQGAGTIVPVSTSLNYNLSSLTPNTAYQYYVRANCGGLTSSWVGPLSFSTICAPYTIPYVEGFENAYTNATEIGGCLSQDSEEGNLKWNSNNAVTSYNRTPRSGNWNAYLKYSNTDWIFIPISLDSGVSYTTDVYARQDGTSEANASIKISYGTSNTAVGMTSEVVAETGVINGDYQKISGNFTPTATGIYYVGIQGKINSSPWYISIDDIKIDVSPNCLAPTALVVSDIADISANTGWNAEGSESQWEVEYGVSGYVQGSGTTVVANNTLHTITGLTANTDYQFYVRAKCGAEDSDWSGPYSFTTLCAAYIATYTQNFDAITTPDIDSCWKAIIDGASSSFSSIETTTFNDLSSPNSVKFDNSGDTSGTYYLISPQFSDLDNAKRVRFQMYKNIGDDSDGDLIEVGVLSNANDLNTYTTIHAFTLTDFTEDNWKLMTVNFASYNSGAAHVVIKYVPGTGNYNNWYLDDFVYEETPTTIPNCATNVSSTEAKIGCGNKGINFSWDAVTAVDGYKLTVGTSSGANDILDNITVMETSYNLTNSTINTIYYWSLTPYNNIGDASSCAEQTIMTAATGCYCVAESTSTSSYIKDFTTTNAVIDLNHMATGYATNGYGDYFDSYSITSALSESFDFSFTSVGGTVGAAIWVDWNKDLIFDPITEKVFETTSYDNGPFTGSIAIPGNAIDGEEYRLRVLIDYNDGTPGDDSCDLNSNRGETEDYKIIIDNSALSIVSERIKSLEFYPNPIKDKFTVRAGETIKSYTITNLVGQIIVEVNDINSMNVTIDMSNYNKGMYLAKIASNNATELIKVIKQ